VSFFAFVRDRWAYIGAYLGFGLLALLVVQLDLWLSHASLQLINLGYVMLLGLVGLCGFLGLEYQRQAGFFRRFASGISQEPLDQLGLVPAPRSLEQQLYARAWGDLYGRLRAELMTERQRGQQQLFLVSQWAHHMKTPVAVIDLELQKAAKQAWPAEAGALLQSVAEENRRLQDALQVMLNLVRVQDFGADLKAEPIDLVAFVRQFVNEQKRAFIAHQVYPRVEAPAGAPLQVQSDAKWLRLVLEQIVSNAIKYSAGLEREGRVLFRCDQAAGEIRLSVMDNGIGIPVADRGRIFSPFFTGTNGRHYPQSTGMGLYLARQICDRLGHRLSVESKEGEGTTLTLHFSPNRALHAGLEAHLTER
jgi:signal transduction histidine kinase